MRESSNTRANSRPAARLSAAVAICSLLIGCGTALAQGAGGSVPGITVVPDRESPAQSGGTGPQDGQRGGAGPRSPGCQYEKGRDLQLLV
jgi:hypothetical protein